jgi:hypothetical protein
MYCHFVYHHVNVSIIFHDAEVLLTINKWFEIEKRNLKVNSHAMKL